MYYKANDGFMFYNNQTMSYNQCLLQLIGIQLRRNISGFNSYFTQLYVYKYVKKMFVYLMAVRAAILFRNYILRILYKIKMITYI